MEINLRKYTDKCKEYIKNIIIDYWYKFDLVDESRSEMGATILVRLQETQNRVHLCAGFDVEQDSQGQDCRLILSRAQHSTRKILYLASQHLKSGY